MIFYGGVFRISYNFYGMILRLLVICYKNIIYKFFRKKILMLGF